MLERLGVAYLRHLSAGLPPPARTDAVHLLNDAEQAHLRRVERAAVLRASLAGALSAGVAAAAEVGLPAWLGVDMDAAPLAATARIWGAVLAVAVVAAFFEVGFVYREALASVHRLSRAAGLDPVTGGSVAAALVRAALELPNPPTPALGVDPTREVSRTRAVLASLAYKAKVGLTNFLLKALVRRALGRAAVRVWLAFVAVPVSVVWNGLVMWRVLREARVRAMGPSFVEEASAALLDPAPPEARLAALRAVASAIVRTRDLHPNLLLLLEAAHGRVGAAPPADLDDPRAFLAALPGLDAADRDVALAVLAVAAVVDGRLTADERRLWAEARRACGGAGPASLEPLRRAFVAGRPRLPDLPLTPSGR